MQPGPQGRRTANELWVCPCVSSSGRGGRGYERRRDSAETVAFSLFVIRVRVLLRRRAPRPTWRCCGLCLFLRHCLQYNIAHACTTKLRTPAPGLSPASAHESGRSSSHLGSEALSTAATICPDVCGCEAVRLRVNHGVQPRPRFHCLAGTVFPPRASVSDCCGAGDLRDAMLRRQAPAMLRRQAPATRILRPGVHL